MVFRWHVNWNVTAIVRQYMNHVTTNMPRMAVHPEMLMSLQARKQDDLSCKESQYYGSSGAADWCDQLTLHLWNIVNQR